MQLIKLGFYSGAGYPDLRFRPSLFDRVAEGMAVLLVVAVWLSAVYFHFYLQQAETAPVSGWSMAGASLLTTLLLGISAYLPMRFYAFPFRLTDNNVGMQCMLAVRFVRILNVFINVLFLSYLLLAADVRFMELLMPVFGVSMALLFMAYYMLAYRWR